MPRPVEQFWTKERTYPELAQPHGRARLVVLGCEVGGRWSEETRQFLAGLAAAKARSDPEISFGDGALSWRVPQQGRFLCLCWKVGVAADGATPTSAEVVADDFREVCCV